MKILVLDDKDFLVQSINIAFPLNGEDRVVAESCDSFEDAIMAIGRHHPTIILLDDDLGNPRDGLQVARVLKEQNPTRYEIISTTGTSDPDILDEYKSLGIPFLDKRTEGLISWIKRRLAEESR